MSRKGGEGEINVENASLKWVIFNLTVASTVSSQTINVRFSHYHSFGRTHLSQYKTQIGFQISKITNELCEENDGKSVLAPSFSMPPGIPDCIDPRLCWYPPPGALQNAFSAILQGFLSSSLGRSALLFPRSPTFQETALQKDCLGGSDLYLPLSTVRTAHNFSQLTDHCFWHCTHSHTLDYFLIPILLKEINYVPPGHNPQQESSLQIIMHTFAQISFLLPQCYHNFIVIYLLCQKLPKGRSVAVFSYR